MNNKDSASCIGMALISDNTVSEDADQMPMPQLG